MIIFLLLPLIFLESTKSSLIEREYKVNNIVFLKDHYSWCQVTPIQQIITSPGYQSITINNNICVGACWSYSIPKTQPAEPGEIIGPYCDSCQPNVTKCYHVTLTAEDTNQAGPKTIQKRVEIIESCHCTPCDKLPKIECDLSQENTSELPQNMYTNKDSKPAATTSDLPDKDIMFFLPKMNANVIAKLFNEDASGTDNKQNVSSRLLKILHIWEKMPNSSVTKTEPQKVGNISHVLQGHEKNELNDFVNYINANDLENSKVDTQKLLEKYAKTRVLPNQSHRNIWLGSPNNEKILEDIRKFQLPASYGIEGGSIGPKHHYRGSHIGMGIKTNEVENLKVVTLPPDADDDSKTTTPRVETSSHSTKNHHYVLEEELVGGKMEHLVKGPHGSLVLRPDIKVEKKLNLETDSLTPNHQGVVITYTGADQNAPKLFED